MQAFDTQRFTQLLAAGKRDEAKQMLKTVLSAELTPAEQGAAYHALAQLYLRVQQGLSEQYLEILQELLPKLETIDQLKGQAQDQGKLADVRGSLAA